MGFLTKLFSGKSEENAKPEEIKATNSQPNTIYAPFKGTVIPLEQINDGVFSSGVLGQGIGMYPEEETVYAPFDGKITQVIDTKHAIGILSNDNIELLIHVGMDTVAMKGKGFKLFVSEGDSVSCGQKLMTFSKSEIAAAGYPDTTAIIITNTDDFNKVSTLIEGPVEKGTAVLITE